MAVRSRPGPAVDGPRVLARPHRRAAVPVAGGHGAAGLAGTALPGDRADHFGVCRGPVGPSAAGLRSAPPPGRRGRPPDPRAGRGGRAAALPRAGLPGRHDPGGRAQPVRRRPAVAVARYPGLVAGAHQAAGRGGAVRHARDRPPAGPARGTGARGPAALAPGPAALPGGAARHGHRPGCLAHAPAHAAPGAGAPCRVACGLGPAPLAGGAGAGGGPAGVRHAAARLRGERRRPGPAREPGGLAGGADPARRLRPGVRGHGPRGGGGRSERGGSRCWSPPARRRRSPRSRSGSGRARATSSPRRRG